MLAGGQIAAGCKGGKSAEDIPLSLPSPLQKSAVAVAYARPGKGLVKLNGAGLGRQALELDVVGFTVDGEGQQPQPLQQQQASSHALQFADMVAMVWAWQQEQGGGVAAAPAQIARCAPLPLAPPPLRPCKARRRQLSISNNRR